ncbi:hypothetical protein [Rathayibacter sp. VKM Ac-2926]|uniref:hypothetical protein n=1 Tax=Rathayibacter sp. VKM Ac-2926 TaxID=2929477 RepID=UPI001FB33D0B|nr:hypothetical protein [Rathayibacter sp. VKM Ac-2926]MCJ1702634.1 hypothetical protein [Rathayibacter sp. VKM Ac-2926]
MPEHRPARARALALATALAVGFGLLVAPAAVAAEAAPSAAPVSETSGQWHTDKSAARQAAPQAAEPRALVAATPPANDLRENATVVTSLPYSAYGLPYVGATLSEGEDSTCRTTDPDYTDYFEHGDGSIWFKYTSTKRQTLTFSGSSPGYTQIVSAFPEGPTTDATRISCAELGFRDVNFLQAEAGRTYYFQVTSDYLSSDVPAGTAQFSLSASAAIPNTTYSSASAISTLPTTIAGSTTKIDSNWYEPYAGCDWNPFMGSVWYKYRATSTGTVRADVGDSFAPMNIASYDSDGVTPGSMLDCGEQSAEPQGYDYSFDRANVEFAVTAGKTYFLQVGNFSFDEGDFVLKVSNVGTLTPATPTISGSATAGDTLTAVPGTWGPSPVALSYQWLSNGDPISDATGPQYVVSQWDLGNAITVQVTGTKAGYATASRTSAAVTVTAGSLTNSVPTVTGSAAIGGTLTANPGNWGPAPVELAYQWKRNGTAIAGATGSSYVVASADSGTALTVSVTGTKYGYTTATRTSSATQVGLPLQTLMPTPTITGSTTVGSTLTANPGTWDSGVTLSYQWKKNGGTYISGATAKTYVLKASDAGATLTVSVTGTKTGYSPATKTSATTAAVTNGAVITGATPTITGTATVGQKLTAVPGTWTPSPVTLAYQWQRNGTAISGATATTYTLVAADAGAAITVAVTGTKSGYTAVTKTSAAVTAKAALQTLMPTPTITGTTKVGSTLTANPGTWDAGTTLSYQWKKNNGTYISGATAKTYVLKASDAGATITVSVTSTKTGYSPATKTSATTALVTGGVLTGATPTITGTAKVGQTLTAVPGTWSPAPVTLSYQWKRGGTAISGATSATYKTVSADAGKAITVTVTGTKAGYTTLSKISAAKTVVK